MRAYVPRMPEAIGSVDCGAEGERCDGTDARNAHKSVTNGLLSDDLEDPLRQTSEFAQHRDEDREKRLDERRHFGIAAGQFAHAFDKICPARCAELDAGFPQDRPHHVFDRPHFVENCAARDKKRAP